MPKIVKLRDYKQIDYTTGEVRNHTIDQTYCPDTEPEYVKLYLERITALTDLPRTFAGVLLELLRKMPYASQDQEICINTRAKQKIATNLGKSLSYVNHALTGLVEKELLIHIAKGTYAMNPYIFGRGEWSKIKRIRLAVDFDVSGQKMKAEIQKDDNQPVILHALKQK